MWQKIARLILRRKYYLIAAIALVTLFLGYEALHVRMDYGYARMLSEDDEVYLQNKKFKELFGDEANAIAVGINDSKLLTVMATHIAIDVKDGYSPAWGFSIFDVLSGTLGGFLPMAERYVPVFKYVDLKWSYWINSTYFYDKTTHRGEAVFTDDYVNQTFWASFKPYRLLPSVVQKYYPSWLAFAAGLSINEKAMDFHADDADRRREVYLAIDYDLEAFRPQSRLARSLIKYLNYFKLPAPAIQVYPEFHWFLLYPIKF